MLACGKNKQLGQETVCWPGTTMIIHSDYGKASYPLWTSVALSVNSWYKVLNRMRVNIILCNKYY